MRQRSSARIRNAVRRARLFVLAGLIGVIAIWVGTAFLAVLVPISNSAVMQFRNGGIWYSEGKWDIIDLQVRGGAQILRYPFSGFFPSHNVPAGWIVVPFYYVFAVILIVYLSLVLFAGRTKQPVSDGHCITCGYDLRASSGRCSECGGDVAEQGSQNPDAGANLGPDQETTRKRGP